MKILFDRIRNMGCGRKCRDFLCHYLGGLYHRVDEHHVFLLSGGLAFSLFVSIVPLVLILFSVLGSESLKPEINTFIDRMIPYEAYAEFVKDLVFSRVEEFGKYKNVAGIIGIFGLLFASSTLFSSMRTVLDKVYQVKDEHSILLGKLRDFGFILLVLIYFVTTTTLLSMWKAATEMAEKVEFLSGIGMESLGGAVFGIVSFIIVFLAFLIIYYLVPYRKPPKLAILVSAVSATILWVMAKQIFGFYIAHFVMLKRVYGTYALMVVVAFWIYYTAIVFVIGAEIGQLFRERSEEKKRLASMEEVDAASA